MSNRRDVIKISKDMFTSIRKDLADGMSRKDAGEKYHLNPKTISRVASCPTWLAWTQRKAARKREEAARARDKKAESCPDKSGDSGLFSGTTGARAIDEAIENPDTPAIVDELHEYRPIVLTLGGLPPEVCDRVHYLSTCPEAAEIIARAVVLCPESIQTIINALYFPIHGGMAIDREGGPD